MIFGATADATLTNVDNTISGAGQLGNGQLTLVNEGTIDADGTNALVIDTGAHTVTNTGTLEATGTGGLVIHGDIANSGLLWANGGDLTVTGNVSGSGSAMIDGAATLEFGAASSEHVTFDAESTGTLKLDDLQHFTGHIAGLTNSNALDLADINFATLQTPDFSGDSTHGTLTVTDGTHTAYLDMQGDFTASAWQTLNDGHGGVLVTDSPAAAPSATTPETMAGNTIVTTTPNQTMTGTGGSDTFVFTANFGNDTITNYAPGKDVIQLDHTIFATAMAALTAAQDDGHGNVVIMDTAHDTITLKNVTTAQLHQSDFHIT